MKGRSSLSSITLVLLIVLLLPFSLYADEKKELKVGVIIKAPFSYVTENVYSGFSVNIWKEVAFQAKLQYHFINLGTDEKKGLDALNQGKVDVLIGPISVNSLNVNKSLYSRPYFIDRLGLMRLDNHGILLKVFTRLFVNHLFYLVIIFSCLSIVLALLYTILENKDGWKCLKGKNNFFTHWFEFFISIFTLSIFRTPKRAVTRGMIILWTCACLCFVSLFTGVITSSILLTHVNFAKEGQRNIHSLKGKVVAMMPNGYQNIIQKVYGGTIIPVTNYKDGLKLLAKGKIDGLLDSYVSIKHHFIENPELEFEYADANYYKETDLAVTEVAFAVKEKPLLDKIDKAITYLQDHYQIIDICKKNLEPEDLTYCLI